MKIFRRLIQNLRKPAFASSVWIFLGFGTSNSIRFLGNVILARLLVPEVFGLMAILNTLKLGLELLSDFGIGQSIITNPNGESPKFYNTAWTIQFMRGIGIWLACCTIAYPTALFYEDIRISWLFPVVALSSIFLGFESTARFTLIRRMQQRKLVLLNLTSQLVTLTTMVVWAYFSPDIYALAIGGLSGSVFRGFATHRLLADISNRPVWDKDSLDQLKSFGRWMFASSGLEFLAGNTDRLLLGKILSVETLGIFSIARTLGDAPQIIITRLSAGVLLPTFSKFASCPRNKMRLMVASKRKLLIFPFAVFLSLLAGFGDLPITFLYDERYTDAAWMVQIIFVGIWFSLLSVTLTPVSLAISKPKYTAYGNAFRLLSILLGTLIGNEIFGLLGAIVGVSISFLPYYLCLHLSLTNERLGFWKQDFLATMLFAISLLLVYVVRSSLGIETLII